MDLSIYFIYSNITPVGLWSHEDAKISQPVHGPSGGQRSVLKKQVAPPCVKWTNHVH